MTLTFTAFDMDYCGDWVEVNDGTSTQRYCGSTPGPVTGTTITVKLHTNWISTASGFFAVVTGDVTVITDVTGESGVGKCVIGSDCK